MTPITVRDGAQRKKQGSRKMINTADPKRDDEHRLEGRTAKNTKKTNQPLFASSSATHTTNQTQPFTTSLTYMWGPPVWDFSFASTPSAHNICREKKKTKDNKNSIFLNNLLDINRFFQFIKKV